MKSGFYKLSSEWNEPADVLMENEDALSTVFGDVSCLLIDPITYLHGACDMFALYLASKYGYSIRAYYIERDNVKPLLTHAVCYVVLAGRVHWIDVRGITDDESEMYAPFIEDEKHALSHGGHAIIADYEGTDAIQRFTEDVININRDIPAFMSEIDGMLYEASEMTYDLYLPF